MPHSDPRSRRRFIMDHLIRMGATHVEDFAALLGVSVMTVYRDVGELEKSQLVVRDRGEVRASSSSLNEAAIQVRMSHNWQIKRALGHYVVTFLSPGQSVVIDDSSSVVPMVDYLGDISPLTVITNAEFIASKIRQKHGTQLILLGGEYEAWADSYFGSGTEIFMNHLHADLCIMSTSAVCRGACYHPAENVARLKRVMLKNAHTKILLVDSSKFQKSALYKVAELSDFDVVVTDNKTPRDVIDAMTESGIDVRVVDSE